MILFQAKLLYNDSLLSVNNMATTEHFDLSVSAFAKPPSGHIKSYQNNKEFKYRGTLFRPSSAHRNNSQSAPEDDGKLSLKKIIEKQEVPISDSKKAQKILPSHPNQDTHVKPRRVQSAKGRLERPGDRIEPQNCHFSNGSEFLAGTNNNTNTATSVLNINAAVDIPDKEELDFILRAKILYKGHNELNHKQRIRPSSAKSTFGCPVSGAETLEKDPISAKETLNLKPSIYGLKLGRQVYGNDAYIQEAWANTERNYPFKLKEGGEENPESKGGNREIEESNLPQTLKPLQRWLCRDTHSDVTGLESDKCVVFLSRNYTADELPEVPSPQEASDTLPYTCLVATPRKEPHKKYRHPYFEQDLDSLEWKCRHTNAVDPNTHGDISFLLNPPYRRNPKEIRLEISELENLLQGIGSLSSDCSFVKFQAEIRCARALARKLILPNSSDSEEPTDSFGLLKFYKEHDKAMEIIRERRRICLEELQIIEEG